MLYDQWQRIASERRNRIAIQDVRSGKSWTFGELADEAGFLPKLERQVHCPAGHSVEFVLDVLRAWRDEAVLCPLESGQESTSFQELPSGVRHLKRTSGTTGAVKWIAFTEQQLEADAANIIETMGLREDSPNLGVVSLAHSYGFSNLVLPLLLRGIPLTLVSSAWPESMRTALDSGGRWTLPAVPAMWKSWLDAGLVSASIRLAISAGAPLPLALERKACEQHGLKIHNFLGSSECGGIAYDESDVPRSDASYVGRPMANVDLSLNEDGLLCVNGKSVGLTYWPDPRPNLNHGRFVSSDLAELRDGGVYLRGRAGDVVNIAGRKAWPDQIEQVLLEHSSVKACLVFGIPSRLEQKHEELAACVVADASELDSIQRFVRSRLPAWQTPRHWRCVDNLDANQRGKISRMEWRRRFLENRIGC